MNSFSNCNFTTTSSTSSAGSNKNKKHHHHHHDSGYTGGSSSNPYALPAAHLKRKSNVFGLSSGSSNNNGNSGSGSSSMSSAATASGSSGLIKYGTLKGSSKHVVAGSSGADGDYQLVQHEVLYSPLSNQYEVSEDTHKYFFCCPRRRTRVLFLGPMI